MTDEYTKQLEKQLEEMQQQLSKTQVDLEAANAIIQRNNVQSDDVYTPLPAEIMDGWRLFSITDAPGSNRVWFHLKRPLWGLFKNTEETFNFVGTFSAHGNRSFQVEYFSYPNMVEYTSWSNEKKLILCKAMMTISRQNKFLYVGINKGNWQAVPYGILGGTPERSRKLVDGKIVIEDLP